MSSVGCGIEFCGVRAVGVGDGDFCMELPDLHGAAPGGGWDKCGKQRDPEAE